MKPVGRRTHGAAFFCPTSSIRNGASEANDCRDLSPYVLLDREKILADN